MHKKQSTTIRILSLLKDRKGTVVFLFVLILASTGFDLVTPFISQYLIDTLIEFFRSENENIVKILIWSGIGILVTTVISRVARSAYDYRIFKTVTSIEDKLRFHTFEKYLRLHSLFHHGASSGQIMGRLDRGGHGIYSILYDIFGHNLLPPITVFVGVLIALLIKSPIIALTVFVPLPIYVFTIRKYTLQIHEIEKRSNEQFESVYKEAYDVASNVLTVKKFSQENSETLKQVKLMNRARKTQYDAERLWEIIANIQTFIATIGRIGVILIGGWLVITARSTVGEFVLFITLQNMAYNPLHQLSVILPKLRRQTARVDRMFEVIDEPSMVNDNKDAKELPLLREQIEFKNVNFSYGRKGRPALKGIDIVIPAGTNVALVGRSGSGKTTFINLLLRSFDPTRGSIKIDGNDLRDVTQASLRRQIAVVPQEVDLFSRTIRQNIAYGKPRVSDKDVAEAAKTALAHDFILRLEHGYSTVVGERGIKLSGGERQRVGIARAVLRDPRILILDEATSHLDTESERLIQRATDALIQERTSFIIAHRLSTVIHADIILVFKDGTIEASGTHDELLKTSPTYKRLYELQFSDE